MGRRVRRASVVLVALFWFACAGTALAQDAAESDGANQVTSFDASDSEAMKYPNLWIAYGVVWVLVFGFVWRTWKQQESTDRELSDLRQRLKLLEERHGSE